MEFEWDAEKSAGNIRSRGLDFGAAPAVFDDPNRKIWENARRDYGEARYNMLGRLDGRVLFVTFTLRLDVVRIISFRKANQRETDRYGVL